MSNLDDGHDEVIQVRRRPTQKYLPDADLIERQFELIVDGLQIEYAGKVHALINLCAGKARVRAKKVLYAAVDREKADALLDKLFNQ